jgi:hypothetical protein
VLRLMGDGSFDSDNLDLPVAPGYEKLFARELMNCLHRAKKDWNICELNTLPRDSPAGQALFQLALANGCIGFERELPAAAISLPRAWEQYLQQLSAEDQKNLARYKRRLEKRFQVTVRRCAREQELSRFLEALFRLHQAHWVRAGEVGTFASEARRNFYYDLSRALLARGCLELWALELDGEIVSVQFGFRYRDKVFQLQEGYDPGHSSDRVGTILRAYVLQQIIADGVRVYDFLGGKLGYKARWGAKVIYYRDLQFARRLSLGGAILWSGSTLRTGKNWLRARLPRSAWAVLHHSHVALRNELSRQT